jgi:hypothetical protein
MRHQQIPGLSPTAYGKAFTKRLRGIIALRKESANERLCNPMIYAIIAIMKYYLALMAYETISHAVKG